MTARSSRLRGGRDKREERKGAEMVGFRSRSRAVGLAIAAALYIAAAAAAVSAEFFPPFNVTYDHRALIIGGKRRMLISAGFHYPRATPDMWPDIIAKCKEGGADVIQTYVFWNGHEPSRGQYNFEGRFDLVKFIKLAGSNGLYFHLRIGPYACAEWNFGGFPVWLRDIPGIEFRTNNEPFKAEMQRFVKKIVDLMQKEKLFSWQGGPIILLQIENEYGNIEGKYGQGGKEYIKWAAQLAVGLGAGVPWVMCRQTDAPETIIDACNAYYCDGFRPNSHKKPMLWTEDWNGWYANWGDRLPHRPVEDNAFAVARFFERGGSFHNYYMFFGGTNFGRTAGGPFQITSYDYDAPIDEYGLLSQPKWGHLKDLHASIKLCEPALVAVDNGPQYKKLGPQQEVHVYSSSVIDMDSSLPERVSICSAFLANIDERNFKRVKFLGRTYTLPPWSVSILPDCKHVAYNTAKVGHQISIKTTDSSPSLSNGSSSTHLLIHVEEPISKNWLSFKEPIGVWSKDIFTAEGILEHLNVTKDASDYLWYIIRINIEDEEVSFWKANGTRPSISIGSARDVVRIFVNGKLIGSKVGHWVPLNQSIPLVRGLNEIALLSETVGLKNYGAFIEKDGAGLRGRITLRGMKSGENDLTKSIWIYQVGLLGEYMNIYSLEEHESTNWTEVVLHSVPSEFTWYKTFFDAPSGTDPVAIYLGSMGKGQAWINGHGIGRYWSLVAPSNGCSACNYRGAYNEGKCTTNCGKPTQSWYHIPRAWLQPSDNLLVLFEETGGNPLKISLKLRSTKTICAKVSQDHEPPLDIWSHSDFVSGNMSLSIAPPALDLQCDAGQKISAVTFASFGNPRGSCQQFTRGTCHASNALSVVSKACEGRNSCRVSVSLETFGQDPCKGVVKTLAVEAECSSTPRLKSAQF